MGALISRRALLVGAIAATAASTLAGSLYLPGAGPGLRTLSEAELAVVAAAALTMFPRGAIPVSGVDAGVPAEVDRILTDDLPAIHAAGFRYLLRALEWGPVYSHGARFTQLDRAQREEVLTIWADPTLLPRRIASDALKMVLGMAYFKHPAVLDAMGYRLLCRGSVA